MKTLSRTISQAILIAFIVLLVSCGDTLPPLASNITMVVLIDDTVYQLHYDAGTEQSTQDVLLKGVTWAAISPDRTKLAYDSKSSPGVSVLDLQTKNTTSIVKGQVVCTRWSNESNKMSLVTNDKLYVYDTAGNGRTSSGESKLFP